MASTKMTSTLISQLYKSRCVLTELMQMQNYAVDDFDGFSIAEVSLMNTNNQLDMLLQKKEKLKKQEGEKENGEGDEGDEKENDNGGEEEFQEGGADQEEVEEEEKLTKIYIKYAQNEKTFRQQNVREVVDDLFYVEQVLAPEDTLLIVVRDEPNETLLQEVKHIWETAHIFVILIPLKRLQFNVLKHELVPKHRVLNEREKMNIKRKYNVMSDYEFPELSRFDPVALAIGIRPGQLCEIIRPSKTAISSKYYRICV